MRVDIACKIKFLQKKETTHYIAEWPLCLRGELMLSKHSFHSHSGPKLHLLTYSWPKRKQRFFRETLSLMAQIPNNNREFYIYPWLHMPFVVEENQVLLH